jgi:hypothetical protein
LAQGAKVIEEPNVAHFSFYIDAFAELNSCRNFGMGMGPIPFTAIAEYVRLYKVEDSEEFMYIIRVMDNQFIKSQNANKQQSSDNPKSKASRGKRT